MKIFSLIVVLILVALAILPITAQDTTLSLETRIAALEARVSTLEKHHEASDSDSAAAAEIEVVTVTLERKEAERETPMLEYLNLVFDVRFRGTEVLGDRRVKDIKGTLYFDDAFGDQIAGAGIVKRLSIGMGETKLIEGLMIDFVQINTSDAWKRVLNTPKEELSVRFVLDQVIYEEEE